MFFLAGGLFAALHLIELGYRPIVVERGKDVHTRKKDIARIRADQKVDPESNYSFGEGGAGAFSDGKLYTRSKKRGNCEKILNVFVQHGASPNIMIDVHPHIGTDKLPRIIENMRNTILRCGGEVRYVHVEAKGLAVGVRLEHPAHLIDQIQYHNRQGRGKWLPAAEYSMVQQVDGRGVYSFCMCPGGFVVPAASGPQQIVVNGMSPSNRGGKWSNSGMVVELHPEDLPSGTSKDDPLRMMYFQEELERQSWLQGNQKQTAPAQRMTDFVNGRLSSDLNPSSYAPGLIASPLHFWMPKFISDRLRQAFRIWGKQKHGFLTSDATVIGVETRTSSPVRIVRDTETLQHITIQGLFPCGEGAGYAGGIVSAGIDGERCAEAAADYLTK